MGPRSAHLRLLQPPVRVHQRAPRVICRRHLRVPLTLEALALRLWLCGEREAGGRARAEKGWSARHRQLPPAHAAAPRPASPRPVLATSPANHPPAAGSAATTGEAKDPAQKPICDSHAK